MAAESLAWVRLSEALKLSGISRRTLNRRVDQGQVQREQQNGQYVYSVSDLERVGESADNDQSSETRLLAQAYRLIDLLIVPSRQLNEALAEENRRMRARCEQLERTQVSLIVAREAALDRRTERDLRLKTEERRVDLEEAVRIEREEQRDRGMRTLSKLAPMVLAKLGKQDAAELATAFATASKEAEAEQEAETIPTEGESAEPQTNGKSTTTQKGT